MEISKKKEKKSLISYLENNKENIGAQIKFKVTQNLRSPIPSRTYLSENNILYYFGPSG